MTVKDKILAALYAAENVYCNPECPLKGGSGYYQPIYLDHRNLLSCLKERDVVTGALRKLIEPDTALAGNETAGIALAGLLASDMDVPMLYVRKHRKEGGTKRQIEGTVPAGTKVCLIDDLAITGGNIERAIDVLRAEKLVVDTVVVISAARPDVTARRLKERGVTLQYLVSFQDIISWGEQHRKFTDVQKKSIHEYLDDPIHWGERHGFT